MIHGARSIRAAAPIAQAGRAACAIGAVGARVLGVATRAGGAAATRRPTVKFVPGPDFLPSGRTERARCAPMGRARSGTPRRAGIGEVEDAGEEGGTAEGGVSRGQRDALREPRAVEARVQAAPAVDPARDEHRSRAHDRRRSGSPAHRSAPAGHRQGGARRRGDRAGEGDPVVAGGDVRPRRGSIPTIATESPGGSRAFRSTPARRAAQIAADMFLEGRGLDEIADAARHVLVKRAHAAPSLDAGAVRELVEGAFEMGLVRFELPVRAASFTFENTDLAAELAGELANEIPTREADARVRGLGPAAGLPVVRVVRNFVEPRFLRDPGGPLPDRPGGPPRRGGAPRGPSGDLQRGPRGRNPLRALRGDGGGRELALSGRLR